MCFTSRLFWLNQGRIIETPTHLEKKRDHRRPFTTHTFKFKCSTLLLYIKFGAPSRKCSTRAPGLIAKKISGVIAFFQGEVKDMVHIIECMLVRFWLLLFSNGQILCNFWFCCQLWVWNLRSEWTKAKISEAGPAREAIPKNSCT